MNLGYTRAMIQAALNGELAKTETAKHDIFGLEVPLHVPGVPDEVLMPEQTWLIKLLTKQSNLQMNSKLTSKVRQRI